MKEYNNIVVGSDTNSGLVKIQDTFQTCTLDVEGRTDFHGRNQFIGMHKNVGVTTVFGNQTVTLEHIVQGNITVGNINLVN